MKDEPEKKPPELGPRRARQGFRDWPVLWVLLGGLALGGAYLLYLMMIETDIAKEEAVEEEPAVERQQE